MTESCLSKRFSYTCPELLSLLISNTIFSVREAGLALGSHTFFNSSQSGF